MSTQYKVVLKDREHAETLGADSFDINSAGSVFFYAHEGDKKRVVAFVSAPSLAFFVEQSSPKKKNPEG